MSDTSFLLNQWRGGCHYPFLKNRRNKIKFKKTTQQSVNLSNSSEQFQFFEGCVILVALLDSEAVELFLLGICLHSHPAPLKVVLMCVTSPWRAVRLMCSFKLMGFSDHFGAIFEPHGLSGRILFHQALIPVQCAGRSEG